MQNTFSHLDTIMTVIINKKLTRKPPYIWKLRNTHLNDTWIKDVILIESGKHFEMNDNEIMTYKNLLESARAMVKVLKYKEYKWK